MRLNQDTAISTPRVLLVPYERLHVEKYHRWMQDAGLREATASEQLTADEEYENQQSWRASADKLTFIICRPLPAAAGPLPAASVASVASGTDDAPARMIGDINLFIHQGDGGACNAEIDIMVAEEEWRARGVGMAAVCALLVYVGRHARRIMTEYGGGPGLEKKKEELVLKNLMVKIAAGNEGSAKLFERVGFVRKGEGVNYFGEIEMVMEGFGERLEGTPWWAQSEREYREMVYWR